jgi:hypothetical protein
MQPGVKKWFYTGAGFGAGAMLILALIVAAFIWYSYPKAKTWDTKSITARFEDAGSSDSDRHVFLSYSLQNNTSDDITLTDRDITTLVNLERQKSGRQTDENVKLDLPIFIPAKHSVLSLVHLQSYKIPGTGPVTRDAAEKYVRENFTNLAGFSIFERTLKLEISLPKPVAR